LRIRATVMQLISLDGRVLAESSTKGHRAMDEAFRFPRLLELADSSDEATATVEMADREAYQLVVVPVRAAATAAEAIAFVAMGVSLVERAGVLRDAINLEVSFVDQPTPGTWRLLASSLGSTRGEAVVEAMREREGLGESLTSKRSARLTVTVPD